MGEERFTVLPHYLGFRIWDSERRTWVGSENLEIISWVSERDAEIVAGRINREAGQ